MDELIRELRAALRSFTRRPAVALTAVGILGTGIGASVAVFSVARAVLMRQSPYPGAGDLVTVEKAIKGRLPSAWQLDEYRKIREGVPVLRMVAGCATVTAGARASGDAEEIALNAVTADFFRIFAVAPRTGRILEESDFLTDARSVVLSYDLWASQFQGERLVVGRSIRLNGEPWAVVGVMPEDFGSPCSPRSTRTAWIPFNPGRPGTRGQPLGALAVFARLRADVPLSVARENTYRALSRVSGAIALPFAVDLLPIGAREVAAVRPGLLMLQAVTLLLLIIACANVGNLLLAELAARSSEMGIRLALGATRRDLMRQALTEAAFLSAVGSALGIGIACAIRPLLASLAEPVLPAGAVIALRWPELSLGLALGCLVSLLVGMVPAVANAGGGAPPSLNAAGHTTIGPRAAVFRGALVAAEVSLAVVVCTGTVLLGGSFLRVTGEQLGFDSRDLVIAEVMAPATLKTVHEYEAFDRRISQSIRDRLPGRPLAFANAMPFSSSSSTAEWTLYAPGEAEDNSSCHAEVRMVSREYFGVLRTNAMRGRLFSPLDNPGGPDRPAVVNEEFARRYARTRDVLGLRVQRGTLAPFTVIGVVQDTRTVRAGFSAFPAVYVPFEESVSTRVAVAVRGVDLPAVSRAVRDATASIDRDLPVTGLVSVHAEMLRREGTRQLYASLMAAFAVLAGLLVAGGVLSVAARSTSIRMREIGIRLALGATPLRMANMIVRQVLWPVAAGLGLGTLATWWATEVVSSNAVFAAQLYGATPHDPMALAAAEGALVLLALLASLIPARRASKLDPLTVLRTD